MKKILLCVTFLLFSFFMLEAQVSASKRVVQYDQLATSLSYEGNSSVLIIGQDNRAIVLDKSQEVDFVGFIRATAGIPWKLKTKSGNSFINDFTNSIALSLKGAGFSSKNITIQNNQQLDSALLIGRTEQFDKVILIVANEWMTDQYDVGMIVHDRKLQYDVTLKVYDKNGSEVLSKKFVEPSLELSKKGMGSGDYATFIPAAIKIELGKILNDQQVMAALQGK